MMRTLVAIVILALGSARVDASPLAEQIAVNLHPFGFPAGLDIKIGAFYLSEDRLALFFDQQLPGGIPHTHAFLLMVLKADGKTTAQLTVRGDPSDMDITAGPSGGILVRKASNLDFYDSKLQVLRSTTLSRTTVGIKFDGELNQLVATTVEPESGHRSAHFLNGNTLEETATLTYPIRSQVVFGENQLVYTVSGDCRGAAHIVSNQRSWRSLDILPACDALTFVTSDRLAYAFDGHLHVVDSSGKELFQARIPVPDSFHAPWLVGLSEDHTRLAIGALKRKSFSSGWPFYDEVFVYDLVSNRMIFKRELGGGSAAEALSPNGRQLAIIDQGVLLLIPVP